MPHASSSIHLNDRLNGTLAVLCLGTLMTAASAQQARYVDPALDAANIPYDGNVLLDRGDAQIIRYRNWAALNPVREITTGDYTQELPRNPVDFSDFRYEIDGEEFSLDEFMLSDHSGGLLIIKDGEIVQERYGLGNTEETLWISFSVSKSVTSMLLGAAIKDGYIESVDEAVSDYLPRLKGSSYDDVSIRNVLHMASGVQWNEDYTDLNSDVATYPSKKVIDI